MFVAPIGSDISATSIAAFGNGGIEGGALDGISKKPDLMLVGVPTRSD